MLMSYNDLFDCACGMATAGERIWHSGGIESDGVWGLHRISLMIACSFLYEEADYAPNHYPSLPLRRA